MNRPFLLRGCFLCCVSIFCQACTVCAQLISCHPSQQKQFPSSFFAEVRGPKNEDTWQSTYMMISCQKRKRASMSSNIPSYKYKYLHLCEKGSAKIVQNLPERTNVSLTRLIDLNQARFAHFCHSSSHWRHPLPLKGRSHSLLTRHLPASSSFHFSCLQPVGVFAHLLSCSRESDHSSQRSYSCLSNILGMAY